MLDKPTFTWCDETVALLRSGIVNGLSAEETRSAICERYRKGPTRNAVLGKAWRLGLGFGMERGVSTVAAEAKANARRGFPWTPRAVEVFRELVAQGLSTADIIKGMAKEFHAAPLLSVTAIQQRASILGVSLRRSRTRKPIPAPMAAAPSRPVQDSGGCEVLPFAPAATDFPDDGVTLLDLQFGMCRWVKGDPRDMDGHRYCGAQAKTGSSYCVSHHALAYMPSKDRTRTRAQEAADDKRRAYAMQRWASGLRASGSRL